MINDIGFIEERNLLILSSQTKLDFIDVSNRLKLINIKVYGEN